MKRIVVLLAAIFVVFGMSMPADAALFTVTFEETGITAGTTGDRFDGSQIDNEYTASHGVTWVDALPGNVDGWTGQVVTLPSEFNGDWADSDAMLWNYAEGGGGTTPFETTILLNNPADYFSFEYRRPNKTGTMGVELYLGETLVFSDLNLAYAEEDIGSWNTFTYTEGQEFDTIVLTGDDKFNTDTYAFDVVSIPSPGVQITGFSSDIAAGNVTVGDTVTFTVNASTTPSGGTINYRFFTRKDYELIADVVNPWGGNDWVMQQDWSTMNSALITFDEPGFYYMAVHVSADTTWGPAAGDPQTGMVVEVLAAE